MLTTSMLRLQPLNQKKKHKSLRLWSENQMNVCHFYLTDEKQMMKISLLNFPFYFKKSFKQPLPANSSITAVFFNVTIIFSHFSSALFFLLHFIFHFLSLSCLLLQKRSLALFSQPDISSPPFLFFFFFFL